MRTRRTTLVSQVGWRDSAKVDDISDQPIVPVYGDGTIDSQRMDEHSLEPEQTAKPDSGPTVETDHVLDYDYGQPVRPKLTRRPPAISEILLSTVYSMLA